MNRQHDGRADGSASAASATDNDVIFAGAMNYVSVDGMQRYSRTHRRLVLLGAPAVAGGDTRRRMPRIPTMFGPICLHEGGLLAAERLERPGELAADNDALYGADRQADTTGMIIKGEERKTKNSQMILDDHERFTSNAVFRETSQQNNSGLFLI